jgi:cytochrome c-type biogenesis protein CcmF
MWNMWLIFITFLLSIFGTFLTRSGIVSSVHAFAQSGIGPWFTTFMALIGATCIFFFVKNRDHLQSEHKLESLVSRESSFLFNNVLFLVSAFAVLWGTLFPILSEAVQGTKITVGPPFFNKVNVPIAMVLLFLTAVGPLLAWRKTSVDSLKKNFLIPSIISLFVLIVLTVEMKPWLDVANFYSVVAITLATLVAATIASEFYRGGRVISRKDGSNVLMGMVTLTRRNTRRYGGYVVHMGVVFCILGFAGIAFNQDTEKEMSYGDTMQLGRYTLVCKSYSQDSNPNFDSETAMIDVLRNGTFVETMYPARRVYKASQQPATIVANRSTMREDLYLVYTGVNPDTGRPIIKAHLNPLVWWIWAGAHILLIGTIIALFPNMQSATKLLSAKERAKSIAEVEKSGSVVGAGD